MTMPVMDNGGYLGAGSEQRRAFRASKPPCDHSLYIGLDFGRKPAAVAALVEVYPDDPLAKMQMAQATVCAVGWAIGMTLLLAVLVYGLIFGGWR